MVDALKDRQTDRRIEGIVQVFGCGTARQNVVVLWTGWWSFNIGQLAASVPITQDAIAKEFVVAAEVGTAGAAVGGRAALVVAAIITDIVNKELVAVEMIIEKIISLELVIYLWREKEKKLM